MPQEEKADKKQTADNFAEMFRAFGQAISEIFNDPDLKEKTYFNSIIHSNIGFVRFQR